MAELSGKKIAMLVTNGVEQAELIEPKRVLEAAGARVDVVSLKKKAVRMWNHDDWGAECPIDLHIDEAAPGAYDALLLPGGVMNPDYLRMDARAVAFVKGFFRASKPVAAISHAAAMLITADVIRGRCVTAYPSLKTDVENAGAQWMDEAVVVDGTLVTARRADDLPDFCAAVLRVLTTNSVPIQRTREAPAPPR